MKRKRSSSPENGSTSHGSSGTKYEVFLSFRGPDTRANFTDCLYHTLLEKGISVFIDKKGIDVGEEIGPEIFQAIDDSKICIPIFSTGYASSSWCLRELEHMMSRRKINKLEVMPIFYDMEPSDVKLETEVYRNALTLHEAKHGIEAVQGWAEALRVVAKIKGWDAKNTSHGELAQLIARKVLVKLKVSCVHISEYLVGMEESVNAVIDLLNVESKDIRLIGICGMGGIGKTTLAKVVYRKLLTNFDSHSFISNIREASKGFDLSNVQRQLVSDIIGDLGVELFSTDHGMNMIKDRFCRKKVLIFLDDVDHASQLMALAAKKEWFGLGSRIVVTTRDRSVLCRFQDQFEHCLIYEAKELNNLEALQLFSNHAFRSKSPPNEFLSLSKKVIAKTGGLPLAIEVIGSFLYGKREEAVWQDTLKKMKNFPKKDVKEKLMLSYEALDNQQQQIFLDIACFLAGQDKRYANYMWDDCGYFPNEGIEVLLLMSLVRIGEENELWMHDQLKDLGMSIVYEENCKDPRKGFRVWWNQEEGPDTFQRKKGTETAAAFYLDSLQNFVLTSEDFIKMPNIRFLKMWGVTLSGDFENLFSELRWLSWDGYLEERWEATNFCPKNLLILNLSGSSTYERWGGWTQLKVATRLKVLNLSWCRMLNRTPDLSAFLSLEILILGGCINLLRIDQSISHLRHLKHLNLNHCPALTILPDSIGMLKCLVELDVSRTGIAELPNTIVNLKSLKVLKMNKSLIQKLPEAIGMLDKLEEIYGECCWQLEMIPGDIMKLPFLKILKLTHTLVENVPKLPLSLVNLYLSSRASQKAPEISNLVNLRNLKLVFTSITAFPEEITYNPYCMLALPSITSISSYVGCLCCLEELILNNCKNLRHIGQLPPSLRKLTVNNCNLVEVVDLSDLFNFKNLKDLEVWDCPKLVDIQGLDRLKSLESLYIGHCISLLCLPDLSNWKKLKKWDVDVVTTYSARGKQVARSNDLPLLGVGISPGLTLDQPISY